MSDRVAESGVNCKSSNQTMSMSVTVTQSTATISCVISLSDLTLLRVPGTFTMDYSFTEIVDPYRFPGG